MPAVTSIVTLSDARTHLHIPTADTSRDVELQLFIDGLTPVVEGIVGDVIGHSYTEWYDGMTDTLILRHHPVLTVTTCIEYVGTVNYTLTEQSPDSGNPLDAFGFYVDYDASTVQRTAYGVPSWFAALPWWTSRTPAWYVATPTRIGHGKGRVKIAYTTGRTAVPANIKLGTLELIRANWQPSQNSSVPALGNGESLDDQLPQGGSVVDGYLITPRAMQFFSPHAASRAVVGGS
ncbi:MAG TPA: hypothetical protein VFH54_06130 [Mycobacteriales bacterium]|nr:hypothetical protein [Mycobacteriales bacterium]